VPVMIKLRLPDSMATFGFVQSLPGLAGVKLHESFGLVCISPRESLYVVRADSIDDVERRRQLSPEILGVYGETRIGPMKS